MSVQTLPRRPLGNTGLEVSPLGFGAFKIGRNQGIKYPQGYELPDDATVERLLNRVLDLGINLIDTAEGYGDGHSEVLTGKALKDRRDRWVIATKVQPNLGIDAKSIDETAVRRRIVDACEASLRRMQIEAIDLYQLHGFDATTPIEEAVGTLDGLVRAGKIRYIGCSNFSGWHLMKSLAYADRHGLARYVAHQAYYSLVGRDYEWELMPLALDQ